MTTPAVGSTQQVFIPLPTGNIDAATRVWGNQLVNELRKNLSLLRDNMGAVSTVDDATLLRIGNIESALAELGNVLSTYETLTAQQRYILSLVSAVEEIDGAASRHAKESFEWAQKAAMNDGLSMLKGYIDTGRNRTAVINSQLVQISDREATAQQVFAVNASITSTNAELANTNATLGATNSALSQTNANVALVQQGYVAGDTALASQLSSVSTTVAGNTSGIVQLQQSFNGISAKWSVQVNAQNQAIGLVSLDGSGNTSTFAVLATTFYVAQPSTTGGDPIQVFTIGNRAGVPALGIRADMYLDGSILARHVSVATLSSIAANIGTVTAGVVQSANGKVILNLNTGTFEIYA